MSKITEQVNSGVRITKDAIAKGANTVAGGLATVTKNVATAVNGIILKNRPEQHVAVFGEIGSGKTTLLSAFYGYQQSVAFKRSSGYNLIAKDTDQSQELLRNYYRIEQEGVPPTRFGSRQYSFFIEPYSEGLRANAQKDAVDFIWHDYPGGWWTSNPDEEYKKDKLNTFSALMASDIALFLVDGARLKEEGDSYLKLLFNQFRNELALLEREPSVNSQFPLKRFPRTWLICLSKADLHPEMTAEDFKKKVLGVAGDEVRDVRDEIRNIIDDPDRFDLGEDYLLLSVGKYDAANTKADLKQSFGIDLIAPLAFSLPVKRAIQKAHNKGKAFATAEALVQSLRKATTGWLKWIPLVGYYFSLLDDIINKQATNLEQKRKDAIDDKHYIDAILIAFEEKLGGSGVSRILITR